MQKLIFILTILIGSTLFLHSCYKENTEVRIRIVANDNSVFAQEEKLIVKEQVMTILKSIQFESYEKTINILKQELSEYNTYPINVEFTEEFFPAKSLNGKMIPSGIYKTIKITLGEGKGENWWSILYPEFFGVSYDDTDNIKYKSYFYDTIFGSKIK